jgi:hypothetical protein
MVCAIALRLPIRGRLIGAHLGLIFLLGRRDRPTDGVRDYSDLLAQALQSRGHAVRVVQADWPKAGWWAARKEVWRSVRGDQNTWVLLQYTHLMWSRHGFPLMTLVVAGAVRLQTRNLCVVVHDPLGFPGRRTRDRLRRGVQEAVLRILVRLARTTVVTIPTSSIPWLRGAWAASIPVGSNVASPTATADGRSGGPFTVAVFGVTAGNTEEATEIAQVVNGVQDVIGTVRLLAMGRGAVEAEPVLRGLVRNSDAVIGVTDVVSAEAIGGELAKAHVLLFVRGPLSSRRGSAVAAIAHGLPVVGFEGDETGPPLTEAGVSLVKQGDSSGLVGALVRLAQDPDWCAAQRERSTLAYDRHFRWDRIALRFEELLLSSA